MWRITIIASVLLNLGIRRGELSASRYGHLISPPSLTEYDDDVGFMIQIFVCEPSRFTNTDSFSGINVFY